MKKNIIPKPPFLAELLLRLFAKNEDPASMLGDFDEEFYDIIETKGALYAKLWYWRHLFKSIPAIITNSIIWSAAMFKNYITISFRNIIKYKFYSFINISGLTIGFAFFLMCILFAKSHFSYDTMHENAERIYGVIQVVPSSNIGEQHTALIPTPMLPTILSEFPEVEMGTRLFMDWGMIVKVRDESFREGRVAFVDPEFLKIFSYKLIDGNPETVLSEPNSALLSEKNAKKYFGDEDPIGKFLILNRKTSLKITGILEDFPDDTGIHSGIFASLETARSMYDWMDDWNTNIQCIFVLLKENINPDLLKNKFSGIVTANMSQNQTPPSRMYLLPLLDYHFRPPSLEAPYIYNASIVESYLFIGLGIILLIIVCFNFANLSTSRSLSRAKEIGMRKVIGANRSQLIKQFLGESILISLLALPPAILLYELLLLPGFQALIGQYWGMSLKDYPSVLVIISGVTFLTGIISGCYPAFYLTKFNPVKVLKGGRTGGTGRLRKLFVIAQFAFSAILIVFTIAFNEQFNHIITVDYGFNRNNIIVLPIYDEIRDTINPLKEKMLRNSAITMVSTGAEIPISWDFSGPVIPEGFSEKDSWTMDLYGIDYDFIELFDLKMSIGRSFSRDFSDENSFIINEKAARELQWDNPIGKKLTFENREGTVIGVTEDFLFKNIHFATSPTVMFLAPESNDYLFIKHTDRPDEELINYAAKQWKSVAPEIPFRSYTIEGEFEADTEGMGHAAEIFGMIAIVAIFFSCMGLLGLASFTVERKRKEIGIRKVLGASVHGIIMKTVAEFLTLVVIANILVGPVIYFLLEALFNWAWTSRIDIGIGVFMTTVAVTSFIAVASVIFQSIRAAYSNPVNSLRYE